jgi:hypothetical protein
VVAIPLGEMDVPDWPIKNVCSAGILFAQ